MRALQHAARYVDGGAGLRLGPEPDAQVGEHLGRQVGVGVAEPLGLGHAVQARRVQHAVQGRLLQAAHALGDAGGLDHADRLGVQDPVGPLEAVLQQERDRAALHRRVDGRVDGALLAAVARRDGDAAHLAPDVAQVARPLIHDLPVEVLEVAERLAVVDGPFAQVGQDALEVGQAELRGVDGVVAQVFVLAARVERVERLRAEAQRRVVGVLFEQGLEPAALLLLALGVREDAVAPLDGPLVVLTHARHKLAHAVAGLGDVVEARVVHDARRRAVGVGERAAAQAVDRVGLGRDPVVRQAERVSHLVGGHEADELAHHVLAELRAARVRVDGRRLHEEPVAEQPHHVVEPPDVGLEDLARAGVVDVRPVGVLDVRREVADDTVADVLGAPVGVVGRRVFGADGVFEARRLEGHVPVRDAHLEPLAPLDRRRRVDVVDDRLDRLDELAAGVGLGVRGLQLPARDVAAALGVLGRQAVVHLADGEVAHARVVAPRAHDGVGQQHHRVRHLDRQRARRAVGRRRAGGVGQHRADLDVAGERGRARQERALFVEPAHLVALAHGRWQAEHGHVGREQVGRLDHRRGVAAGGAARLDLEARDHRLELGVAHGLVDRQAVGGDRGVADRAQQQVAALAVPAQRLRARLGAAVLEALGGAADAAHDQHLAPDE